MKWVWVWKIILNRRKCISSWFCWCASSLPICNWTTSNLRPPERPCIVWSSMSQFTPKLWSISRITSIKWRAQKGGISRILTLAHKNWTLSLSPNGIWESCSTYLLSVNVAVETGDPVNKLSNPILTSFPELFKTGSGVLLGLSGIADSHRLPPKSSHKSSLNRTLVAWCHGYTRIPLVKLHGCGTWSFEFGLGKSSRTFFCLIAMLYEFFGSCFQTAWFSWKSWVV